MTWFRVGGAGIPATLKNAMNAVFNKKFGTSGQTYAPSDWPDDVNLLGKLPEKTVSGAIATFADGADAVPLKKCEITLPASLDGYSSVDVVHCGKNLLPMVNYDGGVYNPDIGRQLNLTVSETQFTKNGNVYSVTTSVSWKTHTVLFPIISGATYYEKWTLSVESGQQGSTRAYLDEDFKVLARYNSNSSDPIVTNGVMAPPTGAKYLAITWTNKGTVVQTLNITEPMIEIGSSASVWEEYNGTTHTATLGRTIYGGQADIVSGEGSETYARVKISDLSWTKQTSGNISYFIADVSGMDATNSKDIVCDVLTYCGTVSVALMPDKSIAQYSWNNRTTVRIRDEALSDETELINTYGNGYIAYPIATPTDFAFDGQEINSLYGVNNFWNDAGGDTTVVYRRDIDLALQAVSSSRGLMMSSLRSAEPMIGEESIPEEINELEEPEITEQEGEDNAR